MNGEDNLAGGLVVHEQGNLTAELAGVIHVDFGYELGQTRLQLRSFAVGLLQTEAAIAESGPGRPDDGNRPVRVVVESQNNFPCLARHAAG